MTLEKVQVLIVMHDHSQKAMVVLSQKYGLEPQWGVLSDTYIDRVFDS
jgi:hypothetical protein